MGFGGKMLFQKLACASLFWFEMGKLDVDAELRVWNIYDFETLAVSDDYAKINKRNGVSHSPLSYFNYLYNKYVLSLDSETMKEVENMCNWLRGEGMEVDISKITAGINETYNTKIKNSNFYNFNN